MPAGANVNFHPELTGGLETEENEPKKTCLSVPSTLRVYKVHSNAAGTIIEPFVLALLREPCLL